MRYPFIILCLMLLGACQQGTPDEATKEYSNRGDTITVVKNSPLAEKIKTTPAGREWFSKEIITTAVVKTIPTQFAQIAPPFSGRVMKSYLQLGEKIAKDAPLFELSSPDFIEAQKEFFQSKSNYQLAMQKLNRQQDLSQNGVGVKKELEEAQNELELTLQEYRNFSEVIKTYNANPETLRLGQLLTVRSPIAGEVIENSLVVGQFLKEDTDPIAIVADLSKVWIVGNVKEMDIRHIHKNDEVEIVVSAYPDLQVKGKIFHIQQLINEDTRSVEVLIECDNPTSALKQGLFVTAKFKSQATEKVMVPEKSVLQGEESSYVYVQVSKNVYIKRKVKTGDTFNGKIGLESGIAPNEVIVSEGGYFLR